jgi:hypothetical protein
VYETLTLKNDVATEITENTEIQDGRYMMKDIEIIQPVLHLLSFISDYSSSSL